MTTTCNAVEQDLMDHLQDLQDSLDELRRKRTLSTIVGVAGFVVIMGVLLVFMANLHSYATNYPQDALTRALGLEAEQLLGSPETLALGETLRQQATQTLVPAVSKQLEAELPKFHQEIQAQFADLEQFLNTEISQRATQQLAKTAQTIHTGLLQEYGQLPVDGIQQATAAAQAEYVKQLQAMLNGQLQRVAGNVQGLQDSLSNLSRDPGYAALQQATPQQLETNFYAAVLELAAYNLKQEQAGALPNTANNPPVQPAAANSTQPVKKGV
jgi:hypothetical protein